MIKAVIFDYGGVLKKDSKLSEDCAKMYNMSVEEVRGRLDKTKPVFTRSSKGLISEAEFWKEFSVALGKPEPVDCAKKYRQMYRENFVLFTEVFDLVKDLKSRGIKTVVLSNILNFQADIIRENKGYDIFDEVTLSCKEGMQKPDLDIFLLTIKRLGLKPGECVFIDDKETNTAVAAGLGMKTVLAQNPAQIVKDVNNILL